MFWGDDKEELARMVKVLADSIKDAGSSIGVGLAIAGACVLMGLCCNALAN